MSWYCSYWQLLSIVLLLKCRVLLLPFSYRTGNHYRLKASLTFIGLSKETRGKCENEIPFIFIFYIWYRFGEKKNCVTYEEEKSFYFQFPHLKIVGRSNVRFCSAIKYDWKCHQRWLNPCKWRQEASFLPYVACLVIIKKSFPFCFC